MSFFAFFFGCNFCTKSLLQVATTTGAGNIQKKSKSGLSVRLSIILVAHLGNNELCLLPKGKTLISLHTVSYVSERDRVHQEERKRALSEGFIVAFILYIRRMACE